ncbi:putative integral membrane protein [Lyophyllum shimeji]|uniref:Integral membrane protein n=1 Tax=Lyophyllum shimeji TaxID=47721 RepID=A0A9P3PR77_LYOSH|nr:putative integral membrane protein [Lyophyllum shimeji]
MNAVTTFFESISPVYQWPVKFCAATTLVVWILSVLTSNVSQVDRLWTFLPTIYTAYYALLPLWPQEPLFPLCPYTPRDLGWTIVRDFSPRALLMFGLVFIWMCRLSYNTHRRGLFRLQDEDYRWAVLRTKIPPWLFQVVNLTFIAVTQSILLLSLAFPTKTAAVMQPHDHLVLSDLLLAALALVDLALEFTADNQQWAFHSYKHAYLAREKGKSDVEPYDKTQHWPGARLDFTPEDAKRGFITRGLWAYSRHPNFFCEQSFWWIITFFPLLAPAPPHFPFTPTPHHLIPPLTAIRENPYVLIPLLRLLLAPLVDFLPALSLSLLFFSSTLFTESISKGKYPREYAAYQQRVGMFSPLRTWEKGLLLSWQGRRKAVEELVWGRGEKAGKQE